MTKEWRHSRASITKTFFNHSINWFSLLCKEIKVHVYLYFEKFKEIYIFSKLEINIHLYYILSTCNILEY